MKAQLSQESSSNHENPVDATLVALVNLGSSVSDLIYQIECNNYVDPLGHDLKLNLRYQQMKGTFDAASDHVKNKIFGGT